MLQVGEELIQRQGRFWLDGYFKLGNQGSLATPPAGYLGIAAVGGKLCIKNSSGNQYCLDPANPPATGTASALTKSDDTNVTLMLGGSPTVALLAAASITAGWTGTLAITRGGSGQATANNALNAFLPSQTSNATKFLQTDGSNATWANVAASTNALLDGSNHTDTVAGTVARGDVITGQSASAKWTRLAKGTANQALVMDATGTDVVWASNAASGVGGSAIAGQVAYFTAGSTISGSAGHIWDDTAKLLTIAVGAVSAGGLAITGTVNPNFKVGPLRCASVTADSSWSDISLNTDGVIRSEILNLILSARNASGGIKFATGAADTLKAILTSAGNLGVNFTAPNNTIDAGSTGSAITRGIASTQASADAVSAFFATKKSRGTLASPTAVSFADVLGAYAICGYGTSFVIGAQVTGVAAETWDGTHAGTHLLFYTTSTGGSVTTVERIRITHDGTLLVGTTSTILSAAATGIHQVTQLGAGNARNVILDCYSADSVGPQLRLRKSRGTPASPAVVNNADQLGALLFGGARDTSFTESFGVQIVGFANSLWSGTNSEGYLSFYTTPNASVTLTERFRIGSAGQWGIGGATYGSTGDIMRSGGASAAPSWVTVIGLKDTTISTGVGSVKMKSANAATNAAWLPIVSAEGTSYFVPVWTTNNP